MFRKFYISNLIITITIISFNITILINPNIIFNATKDALLLWFNNVIPSLFPFIILNNLLKEFNGFIILGEFFKPISSFLFKHKENGGIAFISGATSGYPLGGKVTADLYSQKLISKQEADYLIMFTNNAGPLFVVGTIGVAMFQNSNIGYFLLFNHILSAIVLGVILSWFKPSNLNIKNNITHNPSKKNFTDAITTSVLNSNSTILLIGGFIIFYSIIVSILNAIGILNLIIHFLNFFLPFFTYNQLNAMLSGFFEMTTGINMIANDVSNLQIDLCVISGILAFGGLSIHGQTLSSIAKTDIKIKNYFIGKILHTALAVTMTYISYNFITIFNAEPTFNNISINVSNSANSTYIYLFYFLVILITYILIIKKKI